MATLSTVTHPDFFIEALLSHFKAELREPLEELARREIDAAVDRAVASLQIKADANMDAMRHEYLVRFMLMRKNP
jgi:hypothetical protein